MNEIEKFKASRKITKALGGTKLRYGANNLVHAGQSTWGDHLYYDNRTGDLVEVNSNPEELKRDGFTVGKVVRTAAELKNNPYISEGIDSSSNSLNPFKMFKTYTFGSYKGKLQGSLKPNSGIIVNGKKYTSKAEWLKEQQAKQATEQQKTTTGATTEKTNTSVVRNKVTPKGQVYWDSQYQNFLNKMTDDLKKWLALRGIDYSTAESMQGYLLRLGKDLGKFGVDNKWGGDSQKAWEDLINKEMKTPAQPYTPVVPEPVIDAPDPFGYKTSNTYEDPNFRKRLKGMGINSNADLINFMHKTNGENYDWRGNTWAQQFRNDVNRALGGDYSDENIRKTFGTQGNWGRGFLGRGDFGDFQNALQTNAGVWNGIYDNKEEAARREESNMKAVKNLTSQYITTPLLPKPAGTNKFGLNNIGTSTLGDVGLGIGKLKGGLTYGK